MARQEKPKRPKSDGFQAPETGPFRPRRAEKPSKREEFRVHLLGPGIICNTEPRGHATPRGRSREELVLDATEGFIPLWAEGTTLRWRFQEQSLDVFDSPTAARNEIRNLFSEAILAWGDASPVQFHEDDDLWDFEIVTRGTDNCNASGCVLASAFFPDSGRHRLTIYPKMYSLDRAEQVETLTHEVGHVFGLRHFFANISETQWPVEIFGAHDRFTIMNYGNLSILTETDKLDLKNLYTAVWSGELTEINGTQIVLVSPYSTQAPAPLDALTLRRSQATNQRPTPRTAAYRRL